MTRERKFFASNIFSRHIFSFACGLALLALVGCGRRESESEVGAPPLVAIGQNGRDELSNATLSLFQTSVAAGGQATGEIVISLAEGWHTYGDPPGDSGMPPMIDFMLPEDWRVELAPLPPARRFEDAAGVTLGYEDELRIGFRLQAPAQAVAGETVDIEANVQWLICKDICLSRSDTLTGAVIVID